MSDNDYQSFSERHGIEKPKLPQSKSMDEDLCNGLWSAFYDHYHEDHIKTPNRFLYKSAIYKPIWTNFLKKPSDEFEIRPHRINPHFMDVVKEMFQPSLWHKVFDLIEYTVRKLPQDVSSDANALIKECNQAFIKQCNRVLERENSVYRIIEGQATQITSEQEIQSIKRAIKSPYQEVNNHIDNALSLFSARENPDYKNSIKESISAVESIVRKITGSTTLTSGIEKLEEHGIKFHPAHEQALSKLYGFTSDADGIRHGAGGKDSLDINQNTARFMLITCSAFVNYIISEQAPT